MDTEIQKKILERINIPVGAGCWEWTSTIDKDGYGRIKLRKIRVSPLMAHRMSYEVFIGKIPEGLQIDHLCRNRRCVNPQHLEPVTCKENIRRGTTGCNAGSFYLNKTHCPQGHPYDEENTYIRKTKSGYARHCKTCCRNRSREFARKKKKNP